MTTMTTGETTSNSNGYFELGRLKTSSAKSLVITESPNGGFLIGPAVTLTNSSGQTYETHPKGTNTWLKTVDDLKAFRDMVDSAYEMALSRQSS